MLDHALRYAAAGWPVFPCNRFKMPMVPGKQGGTGGVHDATTSPDTIRGWWGRWPDANIGCHLGAAGMMALDLDPGHDLAEVERALEGLPLTMLRQRTPRGGEHWIYALADGERVSPSASKIAPSVDVRSWGSYVLLAPSRTALGPHSAAGEYVWAHGDTWPMPKPAYRTDAMVRICGERRQRHAKAAEWLIEPDLAENVGRAIDWLQSDACQPAIEGQGGNRRTYDTAAMMRSFGLSEGAALDLLFQVYNSKCAPPWDYEELAVPVNNAYRYATSPPGNMTPGYREALIRQQFRPVATDLPTGTEKISGRYRLVDREGMDHIADPEWLIPGLLPQGAHALLIGPPGSFKTFIALDMALSVATGSGEGRCWTTVTEAGPVLYALGEGRPGMKQRVEAWEKRHNGGAKAADFTMADPVPLAGAGVPDWEAFCAMALEMSPEGYVLTVIDTLGRSMEGLNDGAQEDASKFTGMVQTLQRKLNTAVLAVQHTPLGDQSRGRGSIVFRADADTALVLHREGEANSVEIKMAKQRDAAEWTNPVHVDLEKIGDTLVAVPGKPQAAVSGKKYGGDAENSIRTLDNILAMVLKSNPERSWLQKDLAETLACRVDVELPSTLLNGMLRDIREQTNRQSAASYDPLTKRWRWKGPK